MIIRYKEQTCQSYWAGYLTAKMFNSLKSGKNLPSLILCMRDFPHLSIVMGKHYHKLKQGVHTRFAVLMYERFTFQPGFPPSLQGSFSEFMMGFVAGKKKVKLTSEDVNLLKELKIPLNSPN